MSEIKTLPRLPILGFETVAYFEPWLAAAPRPQAGIWVKLAEKDVAGLPEADAIDAALCHEWIGAQEHPYDACFWLPPFTTHRTGSR